MKKRIDVLMVENGLAQDEKEARALIMSGRVSFEGRVIDKPGRMFANDISIKVSPGQSFASRAGEKLEHAIGKFGVDVSGRTCLDVGASTGGFTDCLLKRNAKKVYAVDVGYGQLDWKLRNDSRVVVMDRTNIRHLASLPEKVSVVTIDVSFISLRLVLPVIGKFIEDGGDVIVLVKPQFEVERRHVKKGGIVSSADERERVIDAMKKFGEDLGWKLMGGVDSSVPGAKGGNVEHLLWFRVHKTRDGDFKSA